MTDELAWAAGFFDGEGSIHITPKHRLVVAVGQVSRQPLDIFLRLLGGSLHSRPAYGNHQASWKWQAEARSAGIALGMLVPHLVNKKAEAELALDFQSRISRRGPKRLDEWDLAERSACRQALMEIHRPQKPEAIS
jgi:hypothetical protein